MVAEDPATLWRPYMQLIAIEQAFKERKHDLATRPIFHRREERIESQIFVSFIAYCLLVTLKSLNLRRSVGTTRGCGEPKPGNPPLPGPEIRQIRRLTCRVAEVGHTSGDSALAISGCVG